MVLFCLCFLLITSGKRCLRLRSEVRELFCMRCLEIRVCLLEPGNLVPVCCRQSVFCCRVIRLCLCFCILILFLELVLCRHVVLFCLCFLLITSGKRCLRLRSEVRELFCMRCLEIRVCLLEPSNLVTVCCRQSVFCCRVIRLRLCFCILI